MANNHLVILKKPYLDAILSGRKTVELRLIRTKHAPFGKVSAGDRLFLKLSSGSVCATATAETVKTFENLSPLEIIKLKEQYNHYILGSDEYWQSKMDCKFGVLVWLKDVQTIKPVKIGKKDWRAWVLLTERENFGLLS